MTRRRSCLFAPLALLAVLILPACQAPNPDGIGFLPDAHPAPFTEGGFLGPDWATQAAMKTNVSGMGAFEIFDESQRARDRRNHVGSGY
jgi:hypothetical protein